MNRNDMINAPAWRTIFETVPVLREYYAGDPDSHGMNAFMRGTAVYLEKMLYHLDHDHPFVWYNLGISSELIYAFEDVFPVPIEVLGVMNSLVGNTNTVLDFIDSAQTAGIPTDCCSADKIAIGAIHKGLYPEPSCTIGINTPCDAQVVSTQVMAELSEAPFFAIDVPYYDDKETIKHVAAQLQELVPFMEKNTGRRLDVDRLREICELSNQLTEALWEWLEWRKHVPLAQSSKLVAFTVFLQIAFSGLKVGVDMARALLREARERTERKEGFFEERVRAVWYQDPIWSDLQIYDWFERELGLTVPVDIFGYYANEGLIDTTSLETMLHGLARKIVLCQPMSRQLRGSMDIYIRDCMHLLESWNADCCIFAGHIACKHAWGGIGLFKEACRRADIPLLIFEFDMFDPRITSYEDVYFEVERFVNEIVYPRKLRG